MGYLAGVTAKMVLYYAWKPSSVLSLVCLGSVSEHFVKTWKLPLLLLLLLPCTMLGK